MLTLDTLLKNKKTFINIFSRHYPIPVELLRQYKNTWNWEEISENKNIAWSIELINEHKHHLHSSGGLIFNANTGLPWSAELIQTFTDKKIWKWENLKVQQKIIQDPSLLALCLPHWSKTPGPFDSRLGGGYFAFKFTNWGENAKDWANEVVENCSELRWDWLSEVEGFPWTAAFINKHKDKLSWELLSKNSGLPWSLEFIAQFDAYWHWDLIPYARFAWDIEMLEAFKNKPVWRGLSYISQHNPNLVHWTAEIVERFPDKIWWATPSVIDEEWEGIMDYDSIINSGDFVWTPQLFDKISKSIEQHFTLLEKEYADEGVNFRGNQYWTYYCTTSNWSPEFFEFLAGKEKNEQLTTINWDSILKNAVLLWSDDFILQHLDKIKALISSDGIARYLCGNTNFPWNKFIDRFKEVLNEYSWLQLHQNPNFKPDKKIMQQYKDVWSEYSWELIGENIQLDQELVKTFENKFVFSRFYRNPSLTPAIIEKYIDKPWQWNQLSSYQELINWQQIDVNTIHTATLHEFFMLHDITFYANDELLENFLKAINKKEK